VYRPAGIGQLWPGWPAGWLYWLAGLAGWLHAVASYEGCWLA